MQKVFIQKINNDVKLELKSYVLILVLLVRWNVFLVVGVAFVYIFEFDEVFRLTCM